MFPAYVCDEVPTDDDQPYMDFGSSSLDLQTDATFAHLKQMICESESLEDDSFELL